MGGESAIWGLLSAKLCDHWGCPVARILDSSILLIPQFSSRALNSRNQSAEQAEESFQCHSLDWHIWCGFHGTRKAVYASLPTIHLLFCVWLPGKMEGLSSAWGWFIQQRGWSCDHHPVLTEVYVALKSQGIKSNVKLLKPILSPKSLKEPGLGLSNSSVQ